MGWLELPNEESPPPAGQIVGNWLDLPDEPVDPDFSIAPVDGGINIPFTDYKVSMDQGLTRANMPLSREEKDTRNQKYVDHFRSTNKDGTGVDFDREKLLIAGFDADDVDSIQDSLVESAHVPGPGLEVDMISPLSPEFHAANIAMAPIMKQIGIAGSHLLRSFETRGIPRHMVKAVERGDKEALARYAQEIEDIKGLGFGDELFKGGKVSSNIFEQQKYADDVLHPAVGKLRTKLEGQTPYHPSMADDFKGVVTGLKADMDKVRNQSYSDMKANASKNEYPINDLRTQLREKLTSSEMGIPEEAFNKVMKIVDYQKRTMEPAKLKEIKSLTTRIQALQGKQAIAKPDRKILIGNQIDKLKATRKQAGGTKGDIDTVNELDFINMIKRINANSRGSHMGLSTSDVDVQRGLKASKGLVDKYFSDIVEKNNPKVYELFKQSQAKAVEGFKKFGAEHSRTPFGKILDGEDAPKVMDSIMKNPYEVKTIASQLEEVSPGMGKAFTETWLRKQIGPIRAGTGKALGDKGIDYKSVSTSLDNVLNDKDSADNIKTMLGEDKFNQLSSLKSITDSLESMLKDMGYDGPLDDGIRSYIKSGGLRKAPQRALEVGFDKVRQVAGQTYDTLPDMLKANVALRKLPGVGEYVPDISKSLSGRFDKETFAMDRLAKYIKEYSADKGPMREFIETKMGGATATIANEENVISADTIPIVEGMVAAALAPAAIYKALGVTAGTAGYDFVTRTIEKKQALREEKSAEETNIFSLFGSIFK